MKIKSFLLSLTTASTLLTAAIAADAPNPPLYGYIPNNVEMACTLSKASFNNDWIKISAPGSASLGDPLPFGPFYDKNSGMVYVFPPSGPDFSPSNTSPNCDFFAWGTQMFMWLTSSVQDVKAPATSLTEPNADTPYVFESEFFYRLSERQLVPQSSSSQPAQLLPRHTKTDSVVSSASAVDSVAQAGGGDVLFFKNQVSPQKHNSMVFYEVLTNQPTVRIYKRRCSTNKVDSSTISIHTFCK